MLLAAAGMLCLAAFMDGLDGRLARLHGKTSRWGDYLDHTIDRVVDISLIAAIGLNTDWSPNAWFGWAAALLTLLGSYMGTQAQSVGLGRNYGGFSRADRIVVTIVGTLVAAGQVFFDVGDLEFNMPGLIPDAWNGLSAVLAISLVGGLWTFLSRFIAARHDLLDDSSE
jgi:phosphatidylglycerophosphate synthase